MKLVYHEKVQSDVNAIIRYYYDISDSLGDDFWQELTSVINIIREHPTRFHFEKPPLRRANLETFPYCIGYKVFSDHVKIMVIKHKSRNPMYAKNRF